MADIKRTNYFDRQFLRARDFQDEQDYHLDHRRRHNRLLHTPGVAEGLAVSGSTGVASVTVSPGVAVDAQGREIVLSDPATLAMPTGQASVDIFVSYREEPSEPSADPGVTGFTRITEMPNLSVAPAGTVPAGGVLLARAPLNQANGQLNGAVNNSVRTIAGSIIIGDGAITEPKLANNAVSRRTIQDNAVNADKIFKGSVGADELANNAVIAAKLANNAVIETKLADNAVTAAKLQSDASDNAKRAVGKQHIQNGSVSIAQLSANLLINKDDEDVPAATTSGVGQKVVVIETTTENAFYLINTRYVSPKPGPNFKGYTWFQRTIGNSSELVFQNPNPGEIKVAYKVYRLSEA